MKNRINRYTCYDCQGTIITVDRNRGTTPYLMRCRATPDCNGAMKSEFYRVPQTLTPRWEWYKPTKKEVDELPTEIQQHVSMGGLLIRKIKRGAR